MSKKSKKAKGDSSKTWSIFSTVAAIGAALLPGSIEPVGVGA